MAGDAGRASVAEGGSPREQVFSLGRRTLDLMQGGLGLWIGSGRLNLLCRRPDRDQQQRCEQRNRAPSRSSDLGNETALHGMSKSKQDLGKERRPQAPSMRYRKEARYHLTSPDLGDEHSRVVLLPQNQPSKLSLTRSRVVKLQVPLSEAVCALSPCVP